MNRDINNTLAALVPVLRMNGEMVKSIEAVQDWYKAGGREYMKEVAEITYDNGHRLYADIGSGANLTAVYDVIAVIQQSRSRARPYSGSQGDAMKLQIRQIASIRRSCPAAWQKKTQPPSMCPLRTWMIRTRTPGT